MSESSSSSSLDGSDSEKQDSDENEEMESDRENEEEKDDNDEGAAGTNIITTGDVGGDVVRLEHGMYGNIAWKPVTNISGETAARLRNQGTRLNRNMLNMDRNADKSILNYCIMIFPMDKLNSFVLHTFIIVFCDKILT